MCLNGSLDLLKSFQSLFQVPPIASEVLSERPREPDCLYFLKTQRCNFGVRCRFNHPQEKLVSLGALESVNIYALPERPTEPPCAFYMKTGTCKFGVTCKFNHPKDIQIPSVGQENDSGEQTESAIKVEGTIGVVESVTPSVPITPALLHNSKGLPVSMVPPIASEVLSERPREPDCLYFLKTQRCNFGVRCRFNHPQEKLVSLGALESVNIYALPERPTEPPCAFYMKTGTCKFGVTCKFNHPKDIQIPSVGQENDSGEQTESAIKVEGTIGVVESVTPSVPITPALLHNSKGLPVSMIVRFVLRNA